MSRKDNQKNSKRHSKQRRTQEEDATSTSINAKIYLNYLTWTGKMIVSTPSPMATIEEAKVMEHKITITDSKTVEVKVARHVLEAVEAVKIQFLLEIWTLG